MLDSYHEPDEFLFLVEQTDFQGNNCLWYLDEYDLYKILDHKIVDNIMNEDGFDLNDSDFYTRYIVAYNSFKNECQRIKSVVSKVAPVGTGGPEFKRVSLECADAYIDLANLIDAESVINVLNNADEGQYSLIEASYERVDQKENNYILMNERFCNLNDITMGEAVDIEALAK